MYSTVAVHGVEYGDRSAGAEVFTDIDRFRTRCKLRGIVVNVFNVDLKEENNILIFEFEKNKELWVARAFSFTYLVLAFSPAKQKLKYKGTCITVSRIHIQ